MKHCFTSGIWNMEYFLQKLGLIKPTCQAKKKYDYDCCKNHFCTRLQIVMVVSFMQFQYFYPGPLKNIFIRRVIIFYYEILNWIMKSFIGLYTLIPHLV